MRASHHLINFPDSKITNCPIGILTHSGTNSPNVVIDNLEMSNVAATVKDANGDVILGSFGKVDLWALGKRYKGYEGQTTTGAVEAPKKGEQLLDSSGKLFYRSRPQYEKFGISQFRIATDYGCSNNGTGDNTNAINKFLSDAQSAGEIAYFPAGIYRVGGTVLIPTGSRVVGASWSQIQGAGACFSDVFNPRAVVQVGIKGDVGTMEITDMMFNVQGATAGAIVLKWNVHESRGARMTFSSSAFPGMGWLIAKCVTVSPPTRAMALKTPVHSSSTTAGGALPNTSRQISEDRLLVGRRTSGE